MASAYGSSTFARPPGFPPNSNQYHSPDGSTKWKGPKRVCIFCTTAIILPSLLISIPLLMRFVIYGSNTYLLYPSDVRLLDQRISTTWCQAESVKLNTTFTAYVTNGEPTVLETPRSLIIDQRMTIPDDQKEYWGLYLLPGSTFKIETCSRFKGGTLLIVRGNKHMQYCAYVGEDDSAGNSDDVSGSTSTEMKQGPGGAVPNPGVDHNILSRLKTFLKTHPNSRERIEKTLEDWMHHNDTENNSTEGDGVTLGETGTITENNENPENSLEHGTIRRRRGAVDVRRDTESGENAAFEDERNENLNSISHMNVSIMDLPSFKTPDSIWKEQHSQHGGIFNDSVNLDDGSDSESESSFSSSEEALLKCPGIITNFKILYDEHCLSEGYFDKSEKPPPGKGLHFYEFRVQERDYYYFIFGSENEKETNLVRARFLLEKIEYKLPEPIHNCSEVEECQIPFGFASSEKVIITLPQPSPNASSNIFYVAETECEPRAHLYLIFVILVPIVILIFAFK